VVRPQKATTVLTRGCGGSEPDAIGRHPELYKLYVENLYQVLCALRPNAPREQGGFTISRLLALTGTFGKLDSWGGCGYNFDAEVEELRATITNLTAGKQLHLQQPEMHDVRSKSDTWDPLPSAAGTVVDRVMGFDY
jgi:hypothetical protein